MELKFGTPVNMSFNCHKTLQFITNTHACNNLLRKGLSLKAIPLLKEQHNSPRNIATNTKISL